MNVFVAKCQRKELIDNADEAKHVEDIFGQQVCELPDRVNCTGAFLIEIFQLFELVLEHAITDRDDEVVFALEVEI